MTDREALLLLASADEVREQLESELRAAERAMEEVLSSGSVFAAHDYINRSLSWLREAVEILFEEQDEQILFLAEAATLKAPFSLWRFYYPGQSLGLTFTEALREVALQVGLEARPLRAMRQMHYRSLLARPCETSQTDILSTIFEEFMRLRGAQSHLAQIQRLLGLSREEMEALFKMPSKELDEWRLKGIPRDRSGDVARLSALARRLHEKLLPDRVHQAIRSPAQGLGNRTILQVLAEKGPEPVEQYLNALFSYRAA